MEINSPSPTSPQGHTMCSDSDVASAASSRVNPFSIDYILSSQAAKQQQQQQSADRQNPLSQLDLRSQQRLQMEAFVANNQSNEQQQHRANQANAIAPPTQTQSQVKQQTHPQSLPQTHPNFIYFMACMLLQRQQQQQQQVAAAAAVAAQHQAEVSNLQRQRQQLASAAASSARQPVDLAPAQSPMDSLAILARLTGGLPEPGANFEQTVGAAKRNPKLGNGNQHQHLGATNARHQPYPQPPPPMVHNNLFSCPPHQLPASQQARQTNMGLQVPMLNNLFALQPQHQHQQLARAPAKPSHTINNGQATCNFPTKVEQPMQRAQQHRILFNDGSGGCRNSTIVTHQAPISTCTSTSATSNIIRNDNANPDCNPDGKLDNLKPAHSYIGLIGMCILSTPEKRMVLNDIYQFILDNYPYYRNRGSGWRNSVRHNLSLNECFQKAGRAANGKGHYWTIHPANMEDFMMGDFRRRRAQRKVRRWNNMDVPSDESDDESMDDVNKPPLPEHFKRSIEMHKRLEMSYQKSASEATAAAFMAAAAAVAASQQNASNIATPPSCAPMASHLSHPVASNGHQNNPILNQQLGGSGGSSSGNHHLESRSSPLLSPPMTSSHSIASSLDIVECDESPHYRKQANFSQ